jgi:hypothetical protein
MDSTRTVIVPVPSLASMAISWAYGVGLGLMGLLTYFLGIGTVVVLTCGTSAAGGDVNCTLGPGVGSILVLLSTLFLIGSAFGLVDGERMYSLRSRARDQQLVGRERRAAPSGSGTGDHPCPYCGHVNLAEFAFCQRCGRKIPLVP